MEDQMKIARIEQLLEENLELAEENNKLLIDMRRAARWGLFIKIIVWAAIIILPLLLLKPIIETLLPSAAGSDPAGLNIFGFPSQEDIERALDTYQGQ